jgi:transposase-like protein
MNEFDQLTNRRHCLELQWIAGDMRSKLTDFVLKNPKVDVSESQKKIDILDEVGTFLYRTFDEYRITEKRNFDLELLLLQKTFEIEKLRAENEQLKENIIL